MKSICALLTVLISCASFVGSAQQASFAGVTGNGIASICDLNQANGIVVTNENGKELNCRYTMSATIKKKTVNVSCTGRELCEDAKTLIKALKPGGILYIDNIKAENIYGVAIDVPAITVKVAECSPIGE